MKKQALKYQALYRKSAKNYYDGMAGATKILVSFWTISGQNEIQNMFSLSVAVDMKLLVLIFHTFMIGPTLQ